MTHTEISIGYPKLPDNAYGNGRGSYPSNPLTIRVVDELPTNIEDVEFNTIYLLNHSGSEYTEYMAIQDDKNEFHMEEIGSLEPTDLTEDDISENTDTEEEPIDTVFKEDAIEMKDDEVTEFVQSLVLLGQL